MGDKPRFATDLYRGTAEYYDRYRLTYPQAMTGDLIERAGLSGDGGVRGRGRLLDLACGTGQLTFPLLPWFAEVWAADREPDMVDMVRAKAEAAGAGNVRAVVADAESLDAPPGHFELAVIGNAFHRLDRDLVAARLFGWLKPGGHVALCWSADPTTGGEEWQRALADTVSRWVAALGAQDRVPANWRAPQRLRPDRQVLAEAGFAVLGRYEFAVERRWRVPDLAGYVKATAALPDSVRGDQEPAFDADVAAALTPYTADGAVRQALSFAYELARKP